MRVPYVLSVVDVAQRWQRSACPSLKVLVVRVRTRYNGNIIHDLNVQRVVVCVRESNMRVSHGVLLLCGCGTSEILSAPSTGPMTSAQALSLASVAKNANASI